MTEYEAVSLFSEFVGNLLQVLFGYISILSAFLVMSYFAASKLNKVLMVIVLTLFSLTSLMFIVQFNYIKTDMENIFSYILELQANGSGGLSWFGENPLWTVRFSTIVQNLVTIGGYFGCLGFFFYQRSRGQSASGT